MRTAQAVAGVPVPRLSFDEFLAFGRYALIRADVPVVIDLPKEVQGLGREGVAERLGDMTATLSGVAAVTSTAFDATDRHLALAEPHTGPLRAAASRVKLLSWLSLVSMTVEGVVAMPGGIVASSIALIASA